MYSQEWSISMKDEDCLVDDQVLFGEDVDLSRETVEKRLGKKSRKSSGLSRKLKIGNKGASSRDSKGSSSQDNKQQSCDDKDFANKSMVITIEDDTDKNDLVDHKHNNIDCFVGNKEQAKRENEQEKDDQILRLNIKVYKKKESRITLVKNLNIAIYRRDPVKKIVSYIEANITKPLLEDIKVYFDGDLVENCRSLGEIGIENEEQLDVRIPFESEWVQLGHPGKLSSRSWQREKEGL